ncbi:MAG: plastocyanin/azurin family copper-binding protein [Candidatus Bathyarchaeia archaeon]
MKKTTLLAIVLVAIGLGSLIASFAYTAYTSANWVQRPYNVGQQQFSQGTSDGYVYPGMMGQGMGQWMSTSGQSVSIQAAIQGMRSVPSYAKVSSDTNTVTLDSQAVSIIALAIMPDEAGNLTGSKPPNYSTGDVFVVDGLINPTLVIPTGASVQFMVVNLDEDMYHNLVVSAYRPPYPYMAMGAMMDGGYWMPFLPPADYSQGVAHEYSYTLSLNQPGTLWYLCTYPSHAESGMYGEITVTG